MSQPDTTAIIAETLLLDTVTGFLVLHREIERKFLIRDDSWRPNALGERCRQGYVLFGPPVSVRVRTLGNSGFLTLKRAPDTPQAPSAPVERLEFEYEIPIDEADAMIEALCGPVVDKTRYRVHVEGKLWEIDEFHGANSPLIIAEIELESPDAIFVKPAWAGEEVTADRRYLNVNLAREPYSQWRPGEREI